MEHPQIPLLEYGRKEPRGWTIRRVARLIGMGLALQAVIAGLLFAIIFFFFRPTEWTPPIPFDHEGATFLSAQVVDRTLEPDANGVIKLPVGSKPLALYNEIYVTRGSTGIVWVMFRTSQGRGTDLGGYLYRSTATTGPIPQTISVLGPTESTPPTAKIKYFVDRQIDSNWYQIHRDGQGD